MFAKIKRFFLLLDKLEEIDQKYSDYKKTINRLSDKITAIYDEVFNIKTISHALGVSINTSELEDLLFDCQPKIGIGLSEDMGEYERQHEIIEICAREFTKKYPLIKKKHNFHGGCLSCITPLEEGIGECRGCQYFDCNWGKPNKSKESKTGVKND